MTLQPRGLCTLSTIGCVALVTLTSTALLAQQRDRADATPRPTGTAVLSGVVTLAADSDVPVRRAIVTLVSRDATDARSMVSDDTGRFAFRGLPAGRYTLTVRKPAHLTNSFGAKRPGQPGTAIAVADAQQVTDIRVALPRGAVITGTLRLATGEPLADTQVIAVPIAQAEAGGRLVATVEFATDDRGVYRIYGLEPGDYLVGALPSIGRGEVELRTRSFEDIVRELTEQAGRPAVTPNATTATATTPEPALVGYAPTYYPGTPVANSAAAVTVGLGEVREGVDIPIAMIPMSTISGTVIGIDGLPAQAVSIATDTIGPPLPLASLVGVRSSRPDADGQFTITNVPPGSYRITAAGGGVTLNPDGSLRSVSSGDQTDWAVEYVQVSGENIRGVALRLQPGLTFSGTLVSEGSGAAPSWRGTRITMQPVNTSGTSILLNGSPLSGVSVRSTGVDQNGAFEITGIQPGNYDVRVQPPPAVGGDWTVRGIVAGGRDLRDAPITFESGSIIDVTISMTDQPTAVTGTLSSASGTPASDYFVVIFAASPDLWHPTSPRFQAVRPDIDGTFIAKNLPAGT